MNFGRGSLAECFSDGGPLSCHLSDVSHVPSFSASSGSRSFGGTLRLPDEVAFAVPSARQFSDALIEYVVTRVELLEAMA